MNLKEELVAQGHPNRPGTKLEAFRAVIIHYTANENPGATDTMNAKYFGREWHVGADGKPAEWNWIRKKDEAGNVILDPATGKPKLFKVEVPFRYGSAQIIADEDSVTVAIPPDEVAWGCGDRPLPYDAIDKGQKPTARTVFGNRQNLQTVNVEICDNADWDKAAANAHEWVASFLAEKGVTVDIEGSLAPLGLTAPPAPGKVFVFRHFDVTGKLCPKPFIDDAAAWETFVRAFA